jgi:hypothetical protein
MGDVSGKTCDRGHEPSTSLGGLDTTQLGSELIAVAVGSAGSV